MNQRINGPYIGVTGITTAEEADQIHEYYGNSCSAILGSGQDWPALMCGVLVNQTTLSGQPSPRSPNRYPAIDRMAEIFKTGGSNRYRSLNLIHYNTSDVSTLPAQVAKIIELSSIALTGFQFNIRFPDPDLLRQIRDQFPWKYLLLQVGGGALQKVGWDGISLAERLNPYAKTNGDGYQLVDAVLIDPSGGRGKELDVDKVLSLINGVSKMDFDLAIAGGFCADTIGLAKPFVDQWPNIAIDAEGRLRDPDDKLSLTKVRAYFDAALSYVYHHPH